MEHVTIITIRNLQTSAAVVWSHWVTDEAKPGLPGPLSAAVDSD